MEDDPPHKSEVSASFHMEAKLSKGYKNINRTFCIKTHPGTYTRKWPKGSNIFSSTFTLKYVKLQLCVQIYTRYNL